MLTIERSLNIYAAGIPQIISLSQYDDDFQLVFTLYTSEGEFTIPSGTTAEVMGTKVDGNGYSASASISGSTVTVTGNKQMTACAGRNVYEIVLTKSGKRLATVNFILKVERAALDADTIQSETVLKELNAIIDSAETSTQAAAEAAASAAAAAESARTLTIDQTLTQNGQAADAKAVGDEISDLKEDLEKKSGLTEEAKVALLACFSKVAWIDKHGQDYYDTLESALYPSEYPKIVAVFNYGQNTIYTDDTLDSLKRYLTVTYFETEESTGTIVSSANYTLSGTLVVGTSTITVVYNNLTTSFKIRNVVDFYNIVTWSTSDLLSVNIGNIVTEKFPEIVSNTGTTNRAIVVCSHGKKEILKYNNNNPIPFAPSKYPIPIPNGATSASITCVGGRPVMSIFEYANGQYTRLEEINNTQWGQATFAINHTGQNLFAMFLMVIGDNNPPSEVNIEYGFS